MKRLSTIVFLIVVVFGAAGSSRGDSQRAFDELTHIIDSARILEADVFAPRTFAKAAKAYAKAESAIRQQKSNKSITKFLAEAFEYTENAIKASEVAKLSLEEYLPARNKARTAKATSLVPVLYGKAEKQFTKATERVESGNVKGALKEAVKANPLFDIAEIEAIRYSILNTADRLIEKAEADDAGKYALSTLDKARTARRKADAVLSSDRYDRTESVSEATRAEYEARHASNIALSVRSLNRNDQAWEKLMLLYEIQMNRVGGAIGLTHLPFDGGPLAAADTLIAYIGGLNSQNAGLIENSENLSSGVASNLQQVLAEFGEETKLFDPVALSEAVNEKVTQLLAENANLVKQLDAGKIQLAELESAHSEINAELSVKLEQEKRFKQAKGLLNPSEGEVLFNSSNDVVLRLSGLSFDVGKSTIKDEHVRLLEKVMQAIKLFPGTNLVIEGHTDASGNAASNVLLSEKRAFAVMQYLRQSLLIPANRIQSMGFGADRPVASNQTRDGRAKNRRIDILIMR